MELSYLLTNKVLKYLEQLNISNFYEEQIVIYGCCPVIIVLCSIYLNYFFFSNMQEPNSGIKISNKSNLKLISPEKQKVSGNKPVLKRSIVNGNWFQLTAATNETKPPIEKKPKALPIYKNGRL